jgi:hypothetical protein
MEQQYVEQPFVIDFYYMIFQPNPKRGILYYWINGEKIKKVLKIEKFLNIFLNSQFDLYPKAVESCSMYTFFMWNVVDNKIIHLFPMTEATEAKVYRDPIMKYVHDFKQGLKTKSSTTKGEDDDTLEHQLLKMGFEPPTEESIQNLKVKLNFGNKEEYKKTGFSAWIKKNIFKR